MAARVITFTVPNSGMCGEDLGDFLHVGLENDFLNDAYGTAMCVIGHALRAALSSPSLGIGSEEETLHAIWRLVGDMDEATEQGWSNLTGDWNLSAKEA